MRPALSLTDTEWITVSGSEAAAAWLREDAPGGALVPPPPPPRGGRTIATTWDQICEYAANRPLRNLRLRATTPAASQALLKLAQPLGADSLALSASVGGEAKDGGTINFAVTDVKPTHPTGPLKIAQLLFNALKEGAEYEADLALDFGQAGRTGLAQQLNNLADEAPDDVTPQAEFDAPGGEQS